MSTASSIITSAFRESNLVAITGTPTTAEQTEALSRLNSIILSTVGNEAGQELRDLMVGGQYDESLTDGAPANVRLVLNLDSGRSIDLHPYPYDGQQVAVADAGASLATNSLVLNGNGRRIEGAASVTLSTNSLSRRWMYRADTGNWVRITDLATSDEMPFPSEFDDYFITLLAMRLNPRHGRQMTEESLAAFRRSESQLRARYRKPRPRQDTGVRGLLGQQNESGSETAFYRGSA